MTTEISVNVKSLNQPQSKKEFRGRETPMSGKVQPPQKERRTSARGEWAGTALSGFPITPCRASEEERRQTLPYENSRGHCDLQDA